MTNGIFAILNLLRTDAIEMVTTNLAALSNISWAAENDDF